MILLIIILTLLLFFLNLYQINIESFKTLDKKTFKALRKSTNICEKPFRPTCNKDKVYSSIRFLENKIDELEYDIYSQNKKFKLYDKEFMAYRKNRKLVKKNTDDARNEAKDQISAMRTDRLKKADNMEKKIYKMNDKNASTVKKNAKKQAKISKKQQHAALKTFKMSGNNPESDEISKMMTKSMTNTDENDTKELNDSLKKVNMPSGFAF